MYFSLILSSAKIQKTVGFLKRKRLLNNYVNIKKPKALFFKELIKNESYFKKSLFYTDLTGLQFGLLKILHL